MQEKSKQKIITKLKKEGFVELGKSSAGRFVRGNPPNQRVVDLTCDPIFIGVSDGTKRFGPGEHGLSDMTDIENFIEDVLRNEKLVKKEEFFCCSCKAEISGAQRSASVNIHKRALCVDCCSKLSGPQEQPKQEEKRVPKPITAECFFCKKSFEDTLESIERATQERGALCCQSCYSDPEKRVQEKPATLELKKKEPEVKPKTKTPQVIIEDTCARPDTRIPVQAYTPQGSIIKGFIPQLKEIGKIKIGKKGAMKESSQGKQFRLPEKFDHFEIVSLIRNQAGDFVPDPIMATLGEKPKELDILLLYNDPTLNFVTRYNEYKGGKCLCQGDGRVAKTAEGDEIECNPETCQVFQEKKCKPNGILSVVLLKSPRLGGVYKFRTTSYNSIRSILSSMFFLSNLTCGVLANIPLKLTVSPMVVQPKDSPTPQTIYVVNLEFAGTALELLEKTMSVAKLHSEMRVKICELEVIARATLTAPETEDEIKEVEAEFYPESQKEAIK